MKRVIQLIGCIVISLSFVCCADQVRYKNPKYSVEERVKDLVSRMTLEEKAAQLDMLRSKEVVVGNTINEENMLHYIEKMNIGAFRDFYPKDAVIANAIQKRAIENSRLGIPLIFIEEGLHGYGGHGSTNFPIPLGNASTWDTVMMNQIGKVIGSEARAHGIHFILGPNLDLARDIRWGRVEETFGEDPYLSARMGVNLIKGMQGDSICDDNAVVSEPKHFAVHGEPENGHNAGPAHIGEREARSEPLYVFEKAVTEANVRGIMAAYHDIDGIPCVSNHWLLTKVLREDWGFKGFVVSDLDAIALQLDFHMTAATEKEAVAASINAGLNMQFYDFPYDVFQNAVIEAVNDGTISMETLDSAVSDVLRVKFELGLFDNPYTDTTLVAQRHRTLENQQLALDVARSSITLLKNENNTLPLNKDVKRITLVGNLADVSSLGGYSPLGSRGVTVYEALKKRFGDDVVIDMISSDISKNFANFSLNDLTEHLHQDGGTPGLKVEFFNNEELEGEPAYTGYDNVAPYWHNLSPAPGVNENHFSARWTGYVDVPYAGTYEFVFNANDRGKLYIDNKLIIDAWDYEQSGVNNTAKVNLRVGKVPVRVEYSEKDDVAAIKCQWRLSKMESENNYFANITRRARASDAVIIVVGERHDEVGEAKDKSDLGISAYDQKLIQAAVAAGKPTATVLLNGRPLILTEIEPSCDAILEAWFPGESGGDAVCDVIFGDYNPSGHLTVTFPKDQNMLPAFYSRKKSSRRYYIDGDGKDVLYSFGHGLSYTEFDYSNVKIESDGTIGGNITVSLDVTNIGDMAGADVVQLYVSDVIGTVSSPIIALKGFSKVMLAPGETSRVTMTLTPEHMSLINRDMERVVEPGEFIISVGKSSSDIVYKESIFLK